MVESNILGPKAAEKVLLGKSYAQGIRAHIQAMWRILMPQLLDFIGERNDALKKMLEKSMQENDLLKLISILENRNFIDAFNGFVASKRNYGNFSYWWFYMEMVQILLLFFVPREMAYGNFIFMYSSVFCRSSTQIMHGGEQYTLIII